MRFRLSLFILLGLMICAIIRWREIATAAHAVWSRIGNRKSIAERLAQYGEATRLRLRPHFARARMDYPPKRIALLGLKEERQLQVYAASENGRYRLVHSYPILAASGDLGPKLREGDQQVPEGIYALESLNPNSAFHLSLRVGYPNEFDREQAKKDGRRNLGGDIMIHGNAVSIGCLAVGDRAAEDLFVLAADTGISAVTIVLSPFELRTGRTVPKDAALPPWTEGLYARIKEKLTELPLEESK